MKLHPGTWHIECDDLTLTENRSPTTQKKAQQSAAQDLSAAERWAVRVLRYDVKVISTEITVKLPLKKRDIENAHTNKKSAKISALADFQNSRKKRAKIQII